jgi:predicted GNAT family N-acyltransferase
VSGDLARAYYIEPLAEGHDRSHFSCGVPALDRYLQNQAGQDARRRVASPFVLIHRPDNVVSGYYTLSNASMELSDLPEPLGKKMPRYRQIPATLLGRLAIDRAFRARGLGEFLLVDALTRASHGSEISASFAVVVEAKDDVAVRFYSKFGFTPVIGQTHRLFLPMKTIGLTF